MALSDVSLGFLIVVLIRLLVPLAIFRWQFFGGIAAVLVDALDVVFITFLNLGDFPSGMYAQIDKALDMYFLSIMLFVSLKWEQLAKWTSISLFSWRAIGVVLFEATGIRMLLFIFPNIFLWFYLFYTARNRYFPEFEMTKKKVVVILLIFLIPKLMQEYVLHIMEAQPWNWIEANIFNVKNI